MSDIFDQFEVGQLPDEISYLFRIAESKGNHPFRNMILSVEPVKSPSTGTLSAFVFASEYEGVEWLEAHPQYNKHKIETTSSDVFIMEVEDLKTDRKIEVESLSLWIRNKDDEWCEFTKPLTDYLGEEMTEKEQLKSSMLDDVREEYEAYINSNDLDDDERALSVCILQMEDDVKESLLKHYDSELVTELLTEIKAGKFDRYV